MVGPWLPATTLAAAGNKLMSEQHKNKPCPTINQQALFLSVQSVPFDRRMRNSQALFTILRENPLNRVSNEVRPGA